MGVAGRAAGNGMGWQGERQVTAWGWQGERQVTAWGWQGERRQDRAHPLERGDRHIGTSNADDDTVGAGDGSED